MVERFGAQQSLRVPMSISSVWLDASSTAAGSHCPKISIPCILQTARIFISVKLEMNELSNILLVSQTAQLRQ